MRLNFISITFEHIAQSSVSFVIKSYVWCSWRRVPKTKRNWTYFAFCDASIQIVNKCIITIHLHNLIYVWKRKVFFEWKKSSLSMSITTRKAFNKCDIKYRDNDRFRARNPPLNGRIVAESGNSKRISLKRKLEKTIITMVYKYNYLRENFRLLLSI